MKCLLFLFVASAQAGLLTPLTSQPIRTSTNNSKQVSDYTFTFNVQSPVPPTGLFNVVFPSANYASGLGVATCSADNGQSTAYACTITKTTVAVQIGQMSSAPSDNVNKVVIRGVKNPDTTGVTGMFRLFTSNGINTIDYSDSFGQVGIKEVAPSFLGATTACTGSCLAGTTDSYSLKFSVGQIIPASAKVTVTAPTSLTFPSPAVCAAAAWPTLICTVGLSNRVTLTNTTPAVASGAIVTITFAAVKSPPVSGSVGTFSLYILDPIVNNVIVNEVGIAGPTVGNSVISTPVICPNDAAPCSPTENYVSISNRMFFSVKFSTTNDIPANGAVTVTFPAAFGTMEDGTCQLVTGFTNYGYTESTQALCTVDDAAKKLTVTNIGYMFAGICMLQVRATAPNAAGVYTPFTITTYYDSAMTRVIDTVTGGSVQVRNMYAPNKWDVTWGAPTLAGTAVTMQVLFRPYTTLLTANLATSAITMRFGSAFTITTPGLASVITPHNLFPPVTLAPTINGGLFAFPLQAFGQNLPNNGDSLLDVTSGANLIILPQTPGEYAVQMCVNHGGTDVDAFQYWFTVIAAPFLSGSVMNYSYDVSKATVYSISFTPTLNVPNGMVPELVSTAWGTIDVQFPTKNTNWQPLFMTDLGTGKGLRGPLSCTAVLNISPASGGDLQCFLIPAAKVDTSTYATVRIYNFNFLPKQVPVTIHIADIYNALTPDVTSTLQILTYTVTQRIYTPLNQQNFTLPGLFYDDETSALPIKSGRSPSPYGDNLNTIQFSPGDVGVVTRMDVVFWPEYSLTANAGNAFIFKFPSSYPLPSSGVTCTINYSLNTPCYTYTVANWLVFTNPTPSMTQHMEYTLSAEGLVNPPTLLPVSAVSMVVVLKYIEMEYVGFQNLPELIPGAISPVSVTADSYAANNIDTTYTFIFTLTHDLTIGCSIVFTFPKRNYVLTTFPTPVCSIVSGLTPLSTGFTCSVDSSSVTIGGFAAYQGGNEIAVRVLHVLNPVNEGKTLNFAIDALATNGYAQDSNTLIPGVTILAGVGVGKLTHTGFGAFPDNGNLVATISVSFLPSRTYPANTVIQITLPIETAVVATLPVCSLSGGLTTLSGCSRVDDHVLSVVTDAAFVYVPAAQSITVSISSMKNFMPGLTSGLVSIAVTYSSTLIDESSDDENNRRFTTSDSANSLSVQSLDFLPITAAEQATYNFRILMTSPLTKNCTFNIMFPTAYPRRLNTAVNCYSPELSEAIDTMVDCHAEERLLVVNGTREVFPPNTFNLTVASVINPNPGDTISQFLFYSLCDSKVIDYYYYDSSLATGPTPSIMSFDTVITSQPYAGFFAELNLSGIVNSPIQTSTADRLFVDFASVYDLTYTGNEIQVDSVATATQFDPSFYSGGRITVTAFDSVSVLSRFTVLLYLVQNPYYSGELPYPVLSYYQSQMKTVLAKTVPNLALVPSFTLTKIGQDITVNNNAKWSQNCGTRTQPISMRLELPASSAFTVTCTSPEGVSVYPSTLSFRAGDIVATFQVSVTQLATEGLYLLKWLVNESTSPPQYTPIRKTPFYVTDNKDETIEIVNIGSIALGGRSAPITVQLSNPPDAGLLIRIVKLGMTPTDVTFQPSNLQFAGGESAKTFDILVGASSTGVTGELILYKEGENHESYVLLRSVYTYGVAQKDSVPPIVVSAKLTAVKRNSAFFSVITTEACTVYAMAAPYGTRAPTQEEVTVGALNETSLAFTPVFNSTVSYQQISSLRLLYNIEIYGLTAQTKYVLHVVAVDLGGTAALTVPNVTFTTESRLTPVYFNLTFTQAPEDAALRSSIARILLINEGLIDVLHDLSFLPTRRLQGNTQVTVAIWSDPGSPQTLTPAQYAALLQGQLSTLYSMISSLVLTGFTVKELKGEKPHFLTTPTATASSTYTIVLSNLALQKPGKIYACLVPSSVTPKTPSAAQIVTGVDAQNVPCNRSASIECSDTTQSTSISDLEGGVNYWVYFSATNNFPRFPDVIAEEEVVAISRKVVSPADTGGAMFLSVCAWALTLDLV